MKDIPEIVRLLNALQAPDNGASHAEADALLLDALVALKAQSVVDAYLSARQRLGFMYA